jgi:hypothetical protein
MSEQEWQHEGKNSQTAYMLEREVEKDKLPTGKPRSVPAGIKVRVSWVSTLGSEATAFQAQAHERFARHNSSHKG